MLQESNKIQNIKYKIDYFIYQIIYKIIITKNSLYFGSITTKWSSFLKINVLKINFFVSVYHFLGSMLSV